MWNIDFCLLLMTVMKDVFSFRIFWALFICCCLFHFFRGKNYQHLLSSVLIRIDMSKLFVPKCHAEVNYIQFIWEGRGMDKSKSMFHLKFGISYISH